MIDILKTISTIISVPILIFIGWAVAVIWRNQEKLYKQQVDILKEKHNLAKEEIEFLKLQVENPSELRAELEIIKSSYEEKIKNDRESILKEEYEKNLLLKKIEEKNINMSDLEKKYENILLFSLNEVFHSLGQPMQVLRSYANECIREIYQYDKKKALELNNNYEKIFDHIHTTKDKLSKKYNKSIQATGRGSGGADAAD